MDQKQPDNLNTFLNRTGNLLIHLLDKCNLHCDHCYLNAQANGSTMLPIQLVERTISEASELGINSIQFSGGEPLLYPHIDEVLKATVGKGLNVTVSTNGTLIDHKIAQLLMETEASVVTSIDGPEKYHDMFRGQKGSFAKTKKGISILKEHGIPVKIVTTVCENSIEYIEWCAEFAEEMMVDILQFQPLEKIGRGEEIQDIQLQQDKLHDLFIRLNDLSVVYAPKGLQIKMTYKSRDFMIAHPCTAYVCNGKSCHRGVEKELKKIVIREDGTILPELVDIDRQFAIGNLYRATLKDNLSSYLLEGYADFDQLCREVYNSTIPVFPYPLVPWNEILSVKSKGFQT